jgi:hypothetical protein
MGNEPNLACGLMMLFCGVISFAVSAGKTDDLKRKWRAVGVMSSSTGSWLVIFAVFHDDIFVAVAFVLLFATSLIALIRLCILFLKNNTRS